MEITHPLMMVSSVDGRYRKASSALAPYASEFGLIKYRVQVKVALIEHFARFEGLPVRELTRLERAYLNSLGGAFSLEDAMAIQQIERTGYGDIKATNHDVQAVEEWLQMKLRGTSLEDLIPWLHFARTSEDINSVAYALMLRDIIVRVVAPKLADIVAQLEGLATRHADMPMLARTHGQPASPTTFGKEMRVFAERLKWQYGKLCTTVIEAKFSGASGNHNAGAVAFPKVDWFHFAAMFIGSLNSPHGPRISVNHYTTQIEPHDSYAELAHTMSRINTILIDLVQDLWRYISDGWVTQRPVEGEVGSTAMPHKVNPINFENAEGNLGQANAFFEFFARKLPVSRLQRDLSDSTVERNFGSAFAHCVIAYDALMQGFGKIYPNADAMGKALDEHPEVVAEALQVILRREGVSGAYNLLKDASRGKDIRREDLATFIRGLPLPETVKEEMLAVTPRTYIGLAARIARTAL